VQYYATHLGVRDYPDELYSMWGQYDDDLVRTTHGWRVKTRIYTCDFRRGSIVTTPAQTYRT
jgi:hypothetical protein